MTDNATKVKKSIESQTHVLALAKKLTKEISGFEIQESFLVHLAILACTSPWLYLSHDSYHLQRCVCVKNPDKDYWPSVNEQLKQLEEEEAEVRNG